MARTLSTNVGNWAWAVSAEIGSTLPLLVIVELRSSRVTLATWMLGSLAAAGDQNDTEHTKNSDYNQSDSFSIVILRHD